MKPGLYKLCKDVAHPIPTRINRRLSRDWTRQAEWQAGTLFVVRMEHGNADSKVPLIPCISQQGRNEQILRGGKYTGAVFEALAPHLEQLPADATTLDLLMYAAHGAPAGEVLDLLLKTKVLTLAQVEAAVMALLSH